MPVNQINVEYWFRLLYECFHGACYSSAWLAWLASFLAHLWVWVVVIGYILSVFSFSLSSTTMRLFDRASAANFTTLLVEAGATESTSSRWQHIGVCRRDRASGARRSSRLISCSTIC